MLEPQPGSSSFDYQSQQTRCCTHKALFHLPCVNCQNDDSNLALCYDTLIITETVDRRQYMGTTFLLIVTSPNLSQVNETMNRLTRTVAFSG